MKYISRSEKYAGLNHSYRLTDVKILVARTMIIRNIIMKYKTNYTYWQHQDSGK